MRRLIVYFNDVKAGILTELEPGSGYRFEYVPEYLSGNYPHISLTMPKTGVPYESDKLFPFSVAANGLCTTPSGRYVYISNLWCSIIFMPTAMPT